jgi:hypothetical protein
MRPARPRRLGLTCQDPAAWEVRLTAPKRDTDLLTPSDGVLWPDELLTSSSAGRHPDHRSREPTIVPSPQAARRHVVRYVLAAWTARTAGKRPRINSMARATIAPTLMAE